MRVAAVYQGDQWNNRNLVFALSDGLATVYSVPGLGWGKQLYHILRITPSRDIIAKGLKGKVLYSVQKKNVNGSGFVN